MNYMYVLLLALPLAPSQMNESFSRSCLSGSTNANWVTTQLPEDEKNQLSAFVDKYVTLCMGAIKQHLDLKTQRQFTQLFASIDHTLPCDYRTGKKEFASPKEYYADMTMFFYKNKAIQNKRITIGGENGLLYGKNGDHYCAWVKKEFSYTTGPATHISIQLWTLLHLTWIPDQNDFRITSVELVRDIKDLDHDQIADTLDLCRDSKENIPVNITGCQ